MDFLDTASGAYKEWLGEVTDFIALANHDDAKGCIELQTLGDHLTVAGLENVELKALKWEQHSVQREERQFFEMLRHETIHYTTEMNSGVSTRVKGTVGRYECVVYRAAGYPACSPTQLETNY